MISSTPWFKREEITVLLRRVEGFLAGYRQNLALLGPESVGKTTLLKRLLQQKSIRSCSLVPLYLEVRESESVLEWAARFIQALLYGSLQAQQIQPLPMELPELLQLGLSHIPRTSMIAKRLLELAEAGKSEEVYDRLWDLPHELAQETGIPCLLVLDEFHRLRHFSVKDPFVRLGRRIMVQSTTMYLVASSQLSIARSILREGLNLLFGQFEVIELGPLDPAACRQAIRAVWPNGRVDPSLEHLLMELVQGYPGCLDLLLHGLMDRRLPENDDKERSLLDLLEALLLEPQGALRVRCEERLRALPTHRSRRLWIQVLTVVAGGIHRVSPIAAVVHRPFSQVVSALRALERAGLVVKQGVFYRISDRLLQVWMHTAYPVLQGSDLTDPAHTRARFRDAAWAWITKVYEAVHGPIERQCVALLRQWDGELVEIDGHRILLPKFERIETVSGPGSRPVIVARRAAQRSVAGPDGKAWLLIPWAGSMEEVQASALVQDLQKPPFKDNRRVVMGATPVDINARLIFQQARIRFWDLHVLNHLLDLYGLARIPLPEDVGLQSGETVPIVSGTIPTSPTDLPIERIR